MDNKLERELVLKCTIYLDMLFEETKDEAAERLCRILDDTGLDYTTWKTEERYL